MRPDDLTHESAPGAGSAGESVDVAPARTPRRALLLGGALAGAAAALGVQGTASAAPTPVLLGAGNTTDRVTSITNTSTAFTSTLSLDSSSLAGNALQAFGGMYGVFAVGATAGVTAGALEPDGFGLMGDIDNENGGTGGGVRGSANGPQSVGVLGTSPAVGVSGSTGSARPPHPGVPTGVQGVGTDTEAGPGIGGVFEGTRAALRLVPSVVDGAPTGGAHLIGEIVVDRVGRAYLCTVSGMPGRWVELVTAPFVPPPKDPPATTTTTVPSTTVPPTAPTTTPTTTVPATTEPPQSEPPVPGRSTLVLLDRPERFVDTRTGLGGVVGPLAGAGTERYTLTGRTGERGDPSLVVPDEATAIVGNVAVIGAAGVALGSFVTLWGAGPRPATASLNFGPAGVTGVIANGVLVRLAPTDDGHGAIQVFHNASCDYVLDVTGYYVEV